MSSQHKRKLGESNAVEDMATEAKAGVMSLKMEEETMSK